jgi:predicted metalloprotease
MCHQLVSGGTPARSSDLRLPLFLIMHNCADWDYQMLLHNWVAIKVVFSVYDEAWNGMSADQDGICPS